MIRRLELSVTTAYLQGGERGWRLTRGPMANDVINHAYLKTPPLNPEGPGSLSFWVGEHGEIQGEWGAQREGTGAL